MKLRVLIACEFSGRVRDAFTALGHSAVSCDLEPSEAPGLHIRGDALEIAYRGTWDLIAAFPPCTYLTKSNAWRWDAIAEERARALEFVRELLDAPAPAVALENPVGAISTAIRPADQYVEPWWFGDPWQKKTGLWLRGLPKLVPAVERRPEGVLPWCQAGYGPRRADGTRRPGGAVRRVADRNRTFPGIAEAMALQWSAYLTQLHVVG